MCAERTHRIAELTFTLASDDFAAAQGQMMKFWGAVRHRWLGTRYFCWLELTREGRVHYHAIWLNPPHRRKVDLLAWVDHHWEPGRTSVRFRDPRQGKFDPLTYIVGYVKKMGKKSYQQQYDEVPRFLRTFMTQRLEIPPAVLAHHVDRDEWIYTPSHVVLGQLVEESLTLVGRLHHQRAATRCTAYQWRRPRPGHSLHLRR